MGDVVWRQKRGWLHRAARGAAGYSLFDVGLIAQMQMPVHHKG